jgi:putative phosphoesterase
MKIAIISDTHDNLENLKKFFKFSKKEKIEILIHCGDVCNGETLKEIEKNFKKIYLSLGNCDMKDEILKKAKETKIFEKEGKIEIENLNIGFCHEFDYKNKKLKDFDFYFFGHSHWPFLKREGKCYLANPGNLAGLFYKATFAILDTKTKKLELKILEKLKIFDCTCNSLIEGRNIQCI